MFRRRPIALLFVVLPALAAAQVQPPRRPAFSVPPATRALLEGRYDDAESLAEKMDARDPFAATVKARVAIARGRYEDAERVLAPVVARLPTSEAALELGLLQRMLGRPDAGITLARVTVLAEGSRDRGELARAARALQALGKFQEANATFRAAAALAPDDPDTNTGWGELFLEKHNKGEALKSFQIALKTDSRWTPALIGSARSLVDENPPAAIGMAKRALEINRASVDAMVFIASQEADSSRFVEAREWLAKALALNPSSLDARSLLAGLAYVQDKRHEFEDEIAKVLAVAPRHGEAYRVVAVMAAHNYRFDEAVELTRRGLTLDDSNPRILADLGAQLLRTGDEPGARVALERSFKIDPFDVATYNMLSLLDTLDTFETIEEGGVILRMHKDEAPVLKEYALPLAQQALRTLGARYEFTPRTDTLIEIFPRHDDFAVRTMGLPGMVGALGVCFGRVVAMDSPKARPPGDFQWEATLWHELAHVITVQMSNQRVPRWLTEGISVFEEKRVRRTGRGRWMCSSPRRSTAARSSSSRT
jgi:tetratricopeptide (TPR) repeat protein